MRRRDMSMGLVLAASGAALGATPDSPVDGALERRAAVTPRQPQYPVGDLRRYGGVGDGVADDSGAWNDAISIGYVYVPAGYAFRLTRPAKRKGPVLLCGEGPSSRLLCDNVLLEVTDGAGSMIRDIWLENVTAPWIITRDPEHWTQDVLHTLRQSNDDGYQPTPSDTDVWPHLNASQRDQQVGPAIVFQGEATGITVSGVQGRFITLIIKDAVNSTVRDCRFRAGKNYLATGGIYFDNAARPRGRGNSAINNQVEYGSFCGIALNGNDDFLVCGNICSHNGESGIKTMQYDGAHPYQSCFRGTLTGNKCFNNFYDGLDLLSRFPQTTDGSLDENDTCHLAVGNSSTNNGASGMNGDGRGNLYVANSLVRNRTFGFWGPAVSRSLVGSNICVGNNVGLLDFAHEILINGREGGSLIATNAIHSSPGQNARAIAMDVDNTAANILIANYATQSLFYTGATQNSPSISLANVDAATMSAVDQAFVLTIQNYSGRLQHAFWETPDEASIGPCLSKINGASAAFAETPTGPDDATAMQAGGKIGSSPASRFWVDSMPQVRGRSSGVAVTALNCVGTALSVRASYLDATIHGQRRVRLCFDFFDAATGHPFLLGVNSIPEGARLQIQFMGRLL